MTEIAEKEGVFQASESTVIKNLLNFKEVRVRDIMTPRTVLKSANEEQSIQEFYNEHSQLRFSRIPMYSENPTPKRIEFSDIFVRYSSFCFLLPP